MGRSETLFRKAEAIKGLCGARVALIVFDCDGGAVKHWPKEPEAVRATIEAYRMFVAKGKKRIRATVDPDPPRPYEDDFSFLDTAMAQKLQAIESKIQTMSTVMSLSLTTSSSSSDWFALAEQSGLDFMDYAAELDPHFESYLGVTPPPPQESPADPPPTTETASSLTTDLFSEAAQSGLDFMDYAADLDLFESYLVAAPPPPPHELPADPPSFGGRVDFGEHVRVQVEEGEEGVHLDSPIFWTNLEDGFSYTDFGLMTTTDYNADFLEF